LTVDVEFPDGSFVGFIFTVFWALLLLDVIV
jgi:hypothetical protein